MKKRILSVILAAAMTLTGAAALTIFENSTSVSAFEVDQLHPITDFKILETSINGYAYPDLYTDEPLYFSSTSTGGKGNVTYRYFISNGLMDAKRTEIGQGYKITEPGRYRINVAATDSKGNNAGTDFFITVK